MKRLLKFVIMFGIFFAAVSVSTWVLSLMRDMDSVTDDRMQHCEKLGNDITKQIRAANYCRQDSECRATNIRCPWGEGEKSCRYITINSKHSAALLQKDATSYINCMVKDEELKAKFDYCFADYNPADCPDLTKIKLQCIDNKCVEVGGE
jgi:hypothetical protein